MSGLEAAAESYRSRMLEQLAKTLPILTPNARLSKPLINQLNLAFGPGVACRAKLSTELLDTFAKISVR